LRQEAQRRMQGHWEGGQAQTRERRQEPAPASHTARSKGTYEARRHKDSGKVLYQH